MPTGTYHSIAPSQALSFHYEDHLESKEWFPHDSLQDTHRITWTKPLVLGNPARLCLYPKDTSSALDMKVWLSLQREGTGFFIAVLCQSCEISVSGPEISAGNQFLEILRLESRRRPRNLRMIVLEDSDPYSPHHRWEKAFEQFGEFRKIPCASGKVSV